MRLKWTNGYGVQEHLFDDETGKVLGKIEGSYSNSRYNAFVYGKGSIGEYMTKQQAQQAVEKHFHPRSRTNA